MALTAATVSSATYTAIYNHLQTGTYAISTNNIHPSENHLQTVTEDYPQVIIQHPLANFEHLTMGSNELYEVPVSVVIKVMDDNAADLKTLKDEIIAKLLQGKTVLRNAGLKGLSVKDDSQSAEPYSAIKTIHNYYITVNATFTGSF